MQKRRILCKKVKPRIGLFITERFILYKSICHYPVGYMVIEVVGLHNSHFTMQIKMQGPACPSPFSKSYATNLPDEENLLQLLYFDQRTGCTAPLFWSEYTTPGSTQIWPFTFSLFQKSRVWIISIRPSIQY